MHDHRNSPAQTTTRTYRTRRPARRSKRRRARAAKRRDPLSRVLASGALARLITYFATRPDELQHIRALARRTGLSPRSLQTELARLIALGIIRKHVVGPRMIQYRLDERHPRWPALRAVVRAFADPADVLREAFADIPDVKAAFIFGSMAKGTQIHEGSDIDVFVIHDDLQEERLARRTLDTGVLLGREVNVVTSRYDELLDRLAVGSSFFRSVLCGPKRWIIGDEDLIQDVLAATNTGCA